MILARKFKTVVTIYRRTGLSEVSRLAGARARAYVAANGVVPSGAAKRASLLSGIYNDRAEFSSVPFDAADAAQIRPALLFPYARSQFGDVAGTAAEPERLSAVEIAIVADCLWRVWDFRTLADRLPHWRELLAQTKFDRRFRQLEHRVALRTGRLHAAAAGLDETGGDAAEWLLRADIYDALGRLPAASAAYQAAMRCQACDHLIRLNWAFHSLKRGHLIEGLVNWAVADRFLGTYPLRRTGLQWSGEDLGERTLLVIFEHGLGDMIQFARFLIPLRERHPYADLVGIVPAVLRGLMRNSFPGVRFVPAEGRDPPFDLFVSSVLLAPVLGAARPEPRAPYLTLGPPAPPSASRTRIGVCWRGHPRQYEMTRSIPLHEFSRLFADETVDFVVLLNAVTETEARALGRFGNVAIPRIDDFVDLGTVIAGCDLVVSVDTAVVHVAAAAGRPVLLLSRPDACWRWGPAGADSPWYPSVEVLRHDGDMDWPRMLEEAARRVSQLSASALADAGQA